MSAAAPPHLRPMSLTELVDQAIRLYRKNFLQFVGIIAVVQIPLTLLNLLLSVVTTGSTVSQLESGYVPPSDDPFGYLGAGYWLGLAGSLVLGVVSYLLLQGVATGALARAVADRYLGRSTDFVQAYLDVGQLWLRIIGALCLVVLIQIGLVVWLLIPCIGWISGVGILLFWALAVTPLVAPIVVLERQRAGAAIRRAWNLTRRRFWWVVGYVGILFLLNLLVVSGPTVLINALFQAIMVELAEIMGLQNASIINVVAQSVVSLIASLIYVPLQLTGMTLMYFDLRVRTEGFDLALLTEGVSGEPGSGDVVARIPAPGSTSLVTGKEFGFFVLLSLIGFALYAALIVVFMLIGFAMMAATGV